MASTTKEERIITAASFGGGFQPKGEYQFVLSIWEGKVEGVVGGEREGIGWHSKLDLGFGNI